MKLFSGILGDQCIIFRDQGSTDSPGGLASISALLEFVSSSVPAVLEYRLFQTSTRSDLPIIG